MDASRRTPPLLTAEDLYALPDDDQDYELVEGRLVVSEPPGFGHGEIALHVGAMLLGFVRPRGLGSVVVESGYVLARRPDTVRGPDATLDGGAALPGFACLVAELFPGAP